jgi:hypothetical protein
MLGKKRISFFLTLLVFHNFVKKTKMEEPNKRVRTDYHPSNTELLMHELDELEVYFIKTAQTMFEDLLETYARKRKPNMERIIRDMEKTFTREMNAGMTKWSAFADKHPEVKGKLRRFLRKLDAKRSRKQSSTSST